MSPTQAPQKEQRQRWLSPREAAEYLNVTTRWLEEQRGAGRPPAYHKLGHRLVRYDRRDLDAFLVENRVEPGEGY